jgi:hypothetical protein
MPKLLRFHSLQDSADPALEQINAIAHPRALRGSRRFQRRGSRDRIGPLKRSLLNKVQSTEGETFHGTTG